MTNLYGFVLPILAAMNRRFFFKLLAATVLRAQTDSTPPLRLDRISSELGLSQNLITCMLQDRQGFLWVGTKDGLNRFDGYRFVVYRHDAFDSTSLSDNYVNALCEDREGRMWVGTQNGLDLFDRTTENFHHCPTAAGPTSAVLPDSVQPYGLSHAFIRDVRENPHDHGAIWIATANGLNKLVLPAGAKNFAAATYTHLRHDPNDPNSLSHDHVTRLAVDGRGVLWVSTSVWIDQVVAISPDRYQVRRFGFEGLEPDSKRALLNKPQRHYLAAGQNGAIWIGIGPGLIRWDATQSKFTYFDLTLEQERTPEFRWEQVLAMREGRDREVWIGALDGLACFSPSRPAGQNFTFYRHETDNPNSVPQSGVHALLQDEAGVLWLGSTGNGLFRYNPQARRFARFAGRADGRIGFWQGASLRALCETSDGSLWFGAANAKLYRMNRVMGEMNLVPAPRQIPAWGIAASMLQDHTGALWIGNPYGLFRLDWNDGRNLHISHFNPKTDSEPLQLQEVHKILQDRDGEIWITTRVYLMRWNRATSDFVRYRYAPDDPATLFQNMYAFIHQDRHGTLWLGAGQGLQRFDRDAGTFKKFATDSKNVHSLSHNVVRAICDDPDDPENVLWIGTAGGGLNRFDMRTEIFEHFTTKDGLPDMVIYAILGDREGNLWMSTNHGLSKFDPRTRTFKNFDVNDGLQDNEFNAASYFKSPSGELFFGGINGFNAFYPEDIRDNPHVPPVVFTDFQIFNRSVPFKEKNSPLTAPINETKELTLSYDQNVFSFEFTALDYTDPAKNRYRYMMENFDVAWYENGTSRTATYTNLDPGEYVFRVQGSNNDGVWNEEGTSIKIIITPPWWETWWAYILYGVIFFGLLYSLRRYEMNRQQFKHRAELEHVQAEKEHVEAEKLKELDHLKSRFFANISHEFRTPLTLILGPLENLLTDSFVGDAKKQYGLMKRNAQRLLRLINQLLDLSKLEAGKLTLEAGYGNLIPFLKGLVYSFESMALRKNIALHFEAETAEIMLAFDRDKMEQIVTNLLSNAFKFTSQGGEIVVTVMTQEKPARKDAETQRIRKESVPQDFSLRDLRAFASLRENEKGFVEITVRDTGAGIPAKRLSHVFDRFYQASGGYTKDQQGTGIGLALTKELVELHGGEIRVTSEVGKGTEFTVLLPMVPVVSDQLSVSGDQASSKLQMAGDQEDHIPTIQNFIDPSIQPSIDPAIQQQGSSIQHPATDSEIILIVEDNPDMRAFIREQMLDTYQILEAEDGQAGLEKAIEAIPDLIISDVMMPKMDGYQLCAKLKTDERTSHVPVVLLTAKSSGESKIEGLELGADDYLIKPFDRHELLARVKNLIAQRRKLRERFSGKVALKPSEIAVTSTDRAFLERALAVVEKYIGDEDFDVETLASEVAMSRRQLHRKLQALINQAPSEFILSVRLQRAAELLQKQAGTIAEIAYMTGFNTPNYFAKCFRKQFGCSAAAYRNSKAGE